MSMNQNQQRNTSRDIDTDEIHDIQVELPSWFSTNFKKTKKIINGYSKDIGVDETVTNCDADYFSDNQSDIYIGHNITTDGESDKKELTNNDDIKEAGECEYMIEGLTRKQIHRYVTIASQRRQHIYVNGNKIYRSGNWIFQGYINKKHVVTFRFKVQGSGGDYKQVELDICNVAVSDHLKNPHDIYNCKCTCESTFICKHITCALLALQCSDYSTPPLKPGNDNTNISSDATCIRIGSVRFDRSDLPPTFDHPSTCFINKTPKDIDEWLRNSDTFKSNNAAVCLLMYLDILKSEQTCPDCGKPMKYIFKQGIWRCQKNKKFTRVSVFKGSSFFEKSNDLNQMRSNKLSNWLSYIYYYKLCPKKYGAYSRAGVCPATGIRFHKDLYNLFKKKKDTEPAIQLGGKNGSTVEFDGCYYTLKKQTHGGRINKNNKKKCLFIVVERDYNKKGRHYQVTYVVNSENTEECLPIIQLHVPFGSRIMADGCGIGKSVFLQKNYEVRQSNHTYGIYVKPNSIVEDYALKVHDNNSETLFNNARRKITFNNGIRNIKTKNDSGEISDTDTYTANEQGLKNYCLENDYINNHTDNTPVDWTVSILQDIKQYY